MFAATLLFACTKDKNAADAGALDEAGASDGGLSRDGSIKGDSAVEADASAKLDGGRDDAGSDATPDAQADASADAGPLDPIVPGEDPPTISNVGYFFDEDLGARILLQGRDANGDIASYTVQFFQGADPVSYDLDNDVETPATSEITGAITPTPNEAGFFVLLEPTPEFVQAIDNVKIFVTDAGGRQSELQSAMQKATPKVTGSCDPFGFNRCSGTSVCAASTSTYRCRSLSAARTAACGAALVLSPPAVTTVQGRVTSPSLWDSPDGCSPNNLKLRPDNLVKLRLASAASRVTLSTNHPHTTFDTLLYTIPTCGGDPVSCDVGCQCADDIEANADAGTPRSTRSVLTLTNLAAGDHYIVVDSFPLPDNTGDTFELTVTVE